MQHFLLSSKARTLSVKKIASLSEMECYTYFTKIRWASNIVVKNAPIPLV